MTTPPTEPDAAAAEPEIANETDAEAKPRVKLRDRISGRTRTLLVAAVLLLVFVLVAATRPVPYVTLGPGPTFNTIGEYDGKPLIKVAGAPTYPTTGHLDLTTVSETGGPYGRLGLGEALRGWLDPHVAVVPTKLLHPPGTSQKQVEQQNKADFSGAESSATVAAFSYLDIPFTYVVSISTISPGSAADGKLKTGDIVVAVDGTKVTSIDNARDLIRATKAGDNVTVRVRRDGKEQDVSLTPKTETQAGKQVQVAGVTLGDDYDSKVKVTYTLTGVGGPSAGLMFSLGLVDKLTTGYLNDGKYVAGTGTIDAEGKVGPIGGIQQKLVGAHDNGATVFLVPSDNCDEAKGAVPKGLRIVKVTTLTSAVDALNAIKAGKPTPTC